MRIREMIIKANSWIGYNFFSSVANYNWRNSYLIDSDAYYVIEAIENYLYVFIENIIFSRIFWKI